MSSVISTDSGSGSTMVRISFDHIPSSYATHYIHHIGRRTVICIYLRQDTQQRTSILKSFHETSAAEAPKNRAYNLKLEGLLAIVTNRCLPVVA